MNEQPVLSFRLAALRNKLASKKAFAPTGSMPPMDPTMMGGAPPMDPAMAGGAPPVDPATMGGGMPPMDPAMAGGAPPMDPAAMGGGMPPMDPAMASGMPPADPAAGGMPPVDPLSMGVMPEQTPQDPIQMMTEMKEQIDGLAKLVKDLVKKLDEPPKQANSLIPKEDAVAVNELNNDHQQADEPISDQAKEELDKPDQGQSFIQKQLQGLQG